MKKIIPLFILFALVLSGFVIKDNLRIIRNESFSGGEVLKYKIHYGPITAGEATIDVSPKLHRINGRMTYKATVTGKTSGSFDLITKVRDTWQTYMDTAALVPHRFYRNIQEGSYRKNETIDFDHYNNTAVVSVKRKSDPRKTTTHTIQENAQDLVSGFYYLRTIDYTNMKEGDKFIIPGFFDEENFNMEVTYKGRETVETKAGDIKAVKLVPTMPENEVFDGKNAVSVYISDDKNKVPVLIQAKMFIGSIKVDLYSYRNLKHKLIAKK